tara:strand:- start:698 stop:871 length:174 start_codon:yes stop_codon:yes gene_type:complete
MNDKEIVCYMLGVIGDVTKDQAIDALKNYTKLNEQQIIQIINEIIEFNNNFKKQLTS